MKWHEAVGKVAPYVVKIETPSGHGTGYLCLYTKKGLAGIATADHVVADVHYWQQPLRIIQTGKGASVLLKHEQRAIFSGPRNDSAVVLFKSTLDLPETPLPLIASDKRMKIGVELGWLGYPSVAESQLCFFTGTVSAHQKNAYFIDGVAIDGVSGGPVFDASGELAQIVGTISAYHYNVTGSSALPGLSFAQDVTHLHETISKFGTLDEARKGQEGADKARRQAASAGVLPPVTGPPLGGLAGLTGIGGVGSTPGPPAK
jgi:S1-C subfamily serine protease